jgi:anthranilate phosphoribosyltransferase
MFESLDGIVPVILDCLEKVLRSQDLSAEESSKLMEEVLSGEATSTQTAAFLVALAMKGETEEELLGMARVLRGKAYLFSQYGPVEVGLANTERRMLTGAGPAAAAEAPGESVVPGSTFNIASAVAFVVAGAGVRVLQQGHRSSGSELESAAVIESLGINTRLPAWKIAQCLSEVGLGFVYEPVISQAMERILFAFREIPVPTAFNLLLPMLNPGGAPALALGVHSSAIVETVARVLARMGIRRAFVFHGSDGLDEITNTGPTLVAEVNDGKIETRRIEPGDFGIAAGRFEDLAGGDARRSADIIESILEGEQGPRRNVVLLNAAPGIVCGGKARDLAEGVRLAGESIDSGRARAILRRLAHFSH